MSITIKEIAKLVGVSRGTVDRALHGRSGVSPEVKAKIEQAAKEYGYSPNKVAKALKTAQNPMKFGVLIPNDSAFYTEVKKGIFQAEEAYAPYGVSVERIEGKKFDVLWQVEVLERLARQNVNGIIAAAADVPKVRACVNKIAEQIPIITYNTDLTNTKRLCFIGQDPIAAGRVSGGLMEMMLRKRGKIALLVGSKTMLAHMQRAEGFRQVMAERDVDGVLTDVYETQETDEGAYKAVRNLIRMYDDLVGICITGSGQAGAGKALAESGKKREIKLACYDMLPETVAYVKNGVVDYTIGQEPFLQGYMPIKMMYEYLAFRTLPKQEKIYTQIDIRVKDNIENKGYEVFMEHMAAKSIK